VSGDVRPARVLLDTCALIWLVNGEKMVPRAVAVIEHAGTLNGVFVSAASAWEIGLLSRPRPDRMPVPIFRPDPRSWFARLLAMPGVRETPVTAALAIDASWLPGEFHADPMDRLIVATARHLCLPVVTRDRRIIAYAQAGHVEAISC